MNEKVFKEVEVLSGNLLEAPEQYIVHQINCCTIKAAGLAKAIFDRFPWADVYSSRSLEHQKRKDLPGNILIRGDGESERFVIGVLGQVYPGKPKFPNSEIDGFKTRQRYFFKSLAKIAQLPNLKSIAFPYMIGCNLAGGEWEVYYKIINNFSLYLPDVKVTIYKLD